MQCGDTCKTLFMVYMKTNCVPALLALFFCIFLFSGCANDDDGRKVTDYKEYLLTVASKKVPGVLSSDGSNLLREVYAVKFNNSDEWKSHGSIGGFTFEKGYEYRIKVSETSYLDHSMGQPAWTECDLLEVISREKKDSEGLPLHFVPAWFYMHFLPEYRYAVEADNKAIIEKELKTVTVLPLDYHYMLYRNADGFMNWFAVKDDVKAMGPGIIKTQSKDMSEFPDSYKILPPEGQILMGGEWSFLDENGNETSAPSFDVFIVRSAGTRSNDLMPAFPRRIYLYKDLTAYYKAAYPEAGVKTVVVAYALMYGMSL